MNTPSTHPRAAAIQKRLARPLAQFSGDAGVRSIIELLNNQRGLGWVSGEERLALVTRLHACLTESGDGDDLFDLDDLCAAFGAGEWDPSTQKPEPTRPSALRAGLSAPALYVIGALELDGETGWDESVMSDVEHGVLRLEKGDERIVFRHKFNSGAPMWFPSFYPRQMRGWEALEPFAFTPKPRETT